MSWKKLLADRRVASEPTSKQELDELREMVGLNLKDAQVQGVSAQGRYEFGYNAAHACASFTPFPASIARTGGRLLSWRGWRRLRFGRGWTSPSSPRGRPILVRTWWRSWRARGSR